MELKKTLFPYQEKAVSQLSQRIASSVRDLLDGTIVSANTFCLQAPTGAGKTVMIAEIIRRLGDPETSILKEKGVSINESYKGLMFVVVAPNSLHNQFYDSLEESGISDGGFFNLKRLEDIGSSRDSLEVNDVLVLNYASFNKESNKSRKDNERGNNLDELFESLRERNIKPVLIGDEAHISFETPKSKEFFDTVISPIASCTVTATPELNKGFVSGADNENTLTKVDRQDVVDSGVIVDFVYVNDEITDYAELSDYAGNELYMYSAIEQAERMTEAYKKEGSNIKALVGIQLSSNVKDPLQASSAELNKDSSLQKDEIQKALDFLKDKYDWTVENNKVAVYTAERKENLDGIEENDNEVKAIIFKAAIAVGWDCPRLKTMALLRNNKSQPFTIQTIGRSMRQPERKKYAEDFLNNAYIYTGNDLTKELLYKHKQEVKKVYTSKRKKMTSLDKSENIGLNKDSRLSVEHNHLLKNEIASAIKEVLEEKEYPFNEILDPVTRKKKLLKAIGMNGKRVKETTSVYSGIINDEERELEETVIDARKGELEISLNYNLLLQEALSQSKANNQSNTLYALKNAWEETVLGISKEKGKVKSVKTGKVFDFSDFVNRVFADNANTQAFLNTIIEIVDKTVENTGKTNVSYKIKRINEKWLPPVEEKLAENSDSKTEHSTNDDYLYDYMPDDFDSRPEKFFVEKFLPVLKNEIKDSIGKYDKIDIKFYKNGTNASRHHSIKYVDQSGKDRLFFPDWYVLIEKNEDLHWFVLETKGKKDLWNQENDIKEKVNTLAEYTSAERERGVNIYGAVLNIIDTNNDSVQIADKYNEEDVLKSIDIETAAKELVNSLFSSN